MLLSQWIRMNRKQWSVCFFCSVLLSSLMRIESLEAGTLLEKIARSQWVDILDQMMTNPQTIEANINEVDSNGNTPLWTALAMGAPQSLVQEFLAHGADVNTVGPDKFSPLLRIIYQREFRKYEGYYYDLILDLISKGADIHARGPGGETVFSGLLKMNFFERVIAPIQKIVELGVDVNQAGSDGLHPLLHLLPPRRDHDYLLAKWLLENSQIRVPNEVNPQGETLFIAVLNHLRSLWSNLPNVDQDIQFLKLMIQKGAHVNLPETRQKTPLSEVLSRAFSHYQYGRMSGVQSIRATYMLTRFLLQNGALVNQRDPDGRTPLELAHRFLKNLRWVSLSPSNSMNEIRVVKKLIHLIESKGGQL